MSITCMAKTFGEGVSFPVSISEFGLFQDEANIPREDMLKLRAVPESEAINATFFHFPI